MSEGRGGSAGTPAAPPRVEADLVRLEAERLPSGLFRHRPVKFVFELGRQERDGRLAREK